MVSASTLVRRFGFFLTSEIFKILAITLAIIHLPLRLYRNRSNSSAPTPRLAVHLTTHEPAPSHPQPRDTLVLIHGFPDSSSLWDSTVSRLTTAGYRCITVDLPGSKGEPVPHIIGPANILKMITDALKPICDTSVTLIGHDWGAFYSLLLIQSQPKLFHRLVLLDVGKLSPQSDTHWTVWFCLLSYQTTLALMYMLGDPCKSLHRLFLKSFDYHARPLEEITLDMSHHYAGVLSAVAKKALSRERKTEPEDTTTLIPHLFVYGQKKIFKFHDSAFVEKVRSTPCGEVVPLPCSHWIMVDVPDEWHRVLTDWLQKSETCISQRQ